MRWKRKERGREPAEGNQGYKKWTGGIVVPPFIDSNRFYQNQVGPLIRPSDHKAESKIHYMKALRISADIRSFPKQLTSTSNKKPDWSFPSLPLPRCDLNDCCLLKFLNAQHWPIKNCSKLLSARIDTDGLTSQYERNAAAWYVS